LAADDDAPPEAVVEAPEDGAGTPTSGPADDGDDGNRMDTADRPESGDGLSPDERRAQRAAERQAAREAERQAQRRMEREAERQAMREAEQVAESNGTTPNDVAGGGAPGMGDTSVTDSETRGPDTAGGSPCCTKEVAPSGSAAPVADAPRSGARASEAPIQATARDGSPAHDTGSGPPNGGAAPPASSTGTSDPSDSTDGASQSSAAGNDMHMTVEERRDLRAAERQAQRRAESAAERQAERAAERQAERQTQRRAEDERFDSAKDPAADFSIVARGISGSRLLPLLDDPYLSSANRPWPDDATFSAAARQLDRSDATAVPIVRPDLADTLFRLIEEPGSPTMTFEAEATYNLLFDAQATSIFDPGQDAPRIQVRATFAAPMAPNLAPVPLPAPGLLLAAALIGLGALRSATRSRRMTSSLKSAGR
jgi:hypothetical protein